MKLIIQIPCYNEGLNIENVYNDLPKSLAGVDNIEFQIIDDCSTDQTLQIAEKLGFKHLLKIGGKNRRWLGRAFRLGVDNALNQDCDILVNTDGDGQYIGADIEKIIEPILRNRAEIVIGNRQPSHVPHFSLKKRFLQSVGNKVISFIAGQPVPDAVSGFRAFSRSALIKLNTFTYYTYTIDSLIQAIHKGIPIEWVNIKTNPATRESRLFSSLSEKVFWSALILVRLAIVHQPFKLMALVSLFFIALSLVCILLDCSLYLTIAAATVSVCSFALAVICDQISVVRSLADSCLVRLNEIRFRKTE